MIPTGQDWCDDEDLFCLATDSGGGPFGNLSAYFSSLAAQIAAEILAEKAALADTLSQADCTIEVFSRPTPSGGPGKGKGNHTYIYIFGTLLPPSGEMIEGGPIDGKLTGQINPPGQGLAAGKWNASDPDNSTNHEIGSALDEPGCVMSLELLNAVNNYNSGPKVAYTFLSGFSYNSNAFTYTLLEDIGEATYFGHPSGFTPGSGSNGARADDTVKKKRYLLPSLAIAALTYLLRAQQGPAMGSAEYAYVPSFISTTSAPGYTQLVAFPPRGEPRKIPIRNSGPPFAYSPDGTALYGQCTPYPSKGSEPLEIAFCKIDLKTGSTTPVPGSERLIALDVAVSPREDCILVSGLFEGERNRPGLFQLTLANGNIRSVLRGR